MMGRNLPDLYSSQIRGVRKDGVGTRVVCYPRLDEQVKHGTSKREVSPRIPVYRREGFTYRSESLKAKQPLPRRHTYITRINETRSLNDGE